MALTKEQQEDVAAAHRCSRLSQETAAPSVDRQLERVAWALCPHLTWMMRGQPPDGRAVCQKCPAKSYYREVESWGTRFCRMMAEKAAQDAIAASMPQPERVSPGSAPNTDAPRQNTSDDNWFSQNHDSDKAWAERNGGQRERE